MNTVIVAFDNRQTSEKIKAILIHYGFSVRICNTGNQVLNETSHMDISVVICGVKLHDMPCVNLRDMLYDKIDMVVLLPSGYSDFGLSNILTVNIPISSKNLVDTVSMLIQTRSRAKPKIIRTEEEKATIKKAKEFLMYNNNLTEEEAHRYIQKRSMDTKSKLIDVARLILEIGSNL